MNISDPHLRQEARAIRIAMYADWLAHDADGLTFNLAYPGAEPLADATAVLAEAREKVALALARIDQAIERDKQVHQENAE